MNCHDGDDNRFHSGNIRQSMIEMIALLSVEIYKIFFRKKKDFKDEIREIIKNILEKKER